MRLIDADRLIGVLKSDSGSILEESLLGIVRCQPTAFDLESVIEQINNIKTDNSCTDCKYRDKCDELQELYNPSDDVDLCALTTKHLALEILKSVANATNGKNGG